jgi:outer membrane receptor protein involved in Fe transport
MKQYLPLWIRLVSLCLVFHLHTFAQSKKISGVVKDDNGNFLPGASILVKDTKIATATNVDGQFSLEVPVTGKLLVISFVGMEPQEIPLARKTTFMVTLKRATVGLNDLVVVGYGTVKKKDLTGSVQRITNEEINSNNPTNVLSAMQGKIAGVNVTQNDGAPGAGVSIRVRGSNSFLGGTEPLYVIDGVPFNNTGSTPASIGDDEKQTMNALAFINPSDI